MQWVIICCNVQTRSKSLSYDIICVKIACFCNVVKFDDNSCSVATSMMLCNVHINQICSENKQTMQTHNEQSQLALRPSQIVYSGNNRSDSYFLMFSFFGK